LRSSELRSIIALEMSEGLASRTRGQEGRARVCFRRAAGWAIATLHPDYDQSASLGNALEALIWFTGDTRYEREVRGSARRLTTRITSDHTLPFEQDPHADADRLIEFVFGEDWRMISEEGARK